MTGLQQRDRLRRLAGGVLDRLRLVEDGVVELDAGEAFGLAAEKGVRGEDDVVLGEMLGCRQAVGRRVIEDAQLGREARRLRFPVEDDGAGCDNERWAPFVRWRAAALVEEREDLHGLAEAHVVGEAASEAEVAEEGEPSEAVLLVGAERAAK